MDGLETTTAAGVRQTNSAHVVDKMLSDGLRIGVRAPTCLYRTTVYRYEWTVGCIVGCRPCSSSAEAASRAALWHFGFWSWTMLAGGVVVAVAVAVAVAATATYQSPVARHDDRLPENM
jgi:hypothetical protein